MVKLYANHLGWVAGRKRTGEILYTDNKAAAKRFPDEYDRELIAIGRAIETLGHHLDKVVCSEVVSDGEH